VPNRGTFSDNERACEALARASRLPRPIALSLADTHGPDYWIGPESVVSFALSHAPRSTTRLDVAMKRTMRALGIVVPPAEPAAKPGAARGVTRR
jgi:hypothetical protein